MRALLLRFRERWPTSGPIGSRLQDVRTLPHVQTHHHDVPCPVKRPASNPIIYAPTISGVRPVCKYAMLPSFAVESCRKGSRCVRSLQRLAISKRTWALTPHNIADTGSSLLWRCVLFSLLARRCQKRSMVCFATIMSIRLEGIGSLENLSPVPLNVHCLQVVASNRCLSKHL